MYITASSSCRPVNGWCTNSGIKPVVYKENILKNNSVTYFELGTAFVSRRCQSTLDLLDFERIPLRHKVLLPARLDDGKFLCHLLDCLRRFRCLWCLYCCWCFGCHNPSNITNFPKKGKFEQNFSREMLLSRLALVA